MKKSISLFRNALLGLSALCGLDRQLRVARYQVKAADIIDYGGVVRSTKFRRSRTYRGRDMGTGHKPNHLRQIRNATRYFRGPAGMWPKTLEKLRAINRAKQERRANWKDPKLQGPNGSVATALAMAA